MASLLLSRRGLLGAQKLDRSPKLAVSRSLFSPLSTHRLASNAALPDKLALGHGLARTNQFVSKQVCSAAASNSDGLSVPQSNTQQKNIYLKIGALGLMFLCVCFNYTLLQNLKDSIVVTAAGAEVLPFLSAYGVLPGSIIFYIYHERITKTIPEKYVFYASLAPLLVFYAVFALVLFPMAPTLHPTHLLDAWKSLLPDGLAGLAKMAVYWLYSVFFVVGELWGGIVISLLFWGFADDACTLQEAKDWYPVLGMIANVGLIVAGAWVKFVSQITKDSDIECLRWLTGTVMVVSALLCALKAFVDKKFMEPMGAYASLSQSSLSQSSVDSAGGQAGASPRKKAPKKKKEDSKGLGTAMEVLKRSAKVSNLAVLVAAYFIVEKLFDFAWKAQLRVLYPSATAYQEVLAEVSQWVGISTIALMATSKYAFKYLGWGGTAILPPIGMLFTLCIFFAAAIISHNPTLVSADITAMVVPLGAAAGVLARVVCKATKYSLFDPAKEMVYITMSKDEKTEGKAAVDLLGSYFGKSGASWLTQALVLVFGSLNRSMPIIAASSVALCLAWTWSTLQLGRLLRLEEVQGIRKQRAAQLQQQQQQAQQQQQQQQEPGPEPPAAGGPQKAVA